MSILMLVLAMNLSSEPGTHEVHLVHGWNIRVEKKLLEEQDLWQEISGGESTTP